MEARLDKNSKVGMLAGRNRFSASSASVGQVDRGSRPNPEVHHVYARRVSLRLNPKTSEEFTRLLETQVIPILRRQKGFQDEIVFEPQDGDEAFGISLWDRKESADAYHRGDYMRVKRIMEHLSDGAPQIESYELSVSTLHDAMAAEDN